MSTLDQCPSSKKAGLPAEKPETAPQQTAGGRVYWRSLDEAINTPDFREFLHREFPAHACELLDTTRRSFLKIMGASLALAGAATLPGCRRPDHKILPYNKKPEDIIPGNPLFYATALPMPGGEVQGVLAETFEGRPTKLEGNPLHPFNRGKSNAMSQAQILGLYDPDRDPSQFFDPDGDINGTTWSDFEQVCTQDIAAYDDTRGEGLAFLVEKSTSPTRASMRDAIAQRWPGASWYVWESADRVNSIDGSTLAFGSPMSAAPKFDQATRIVSLDADFLGLESTLPGARGFASNRLTPGSRDGHAATDSTMSRLYCLECRTTLTGGQADHRMGVRPSRMPGLAVALLASVSGRFGPSQSQGVTAGLAAVARAMGEFELTEAEEAFIGAAASDLYDESRTALVVAGESMPPEIHAIAHAINTVLNGGAMVEYRAIDAELATNSFDQIASLTNDITSGSVSTLITLGTNPVYDAPADLNFAEAYASVGTRIHFGGPDETAAMATHFLGRSHTLEQWGDCRSSDGTVSVIQPMISPLFDTRGDLDFLAMVVGDTSRDAFELVRETMRKLLRERGDGFEKRWRRALHDGHVAGTTVTTQSARPRIRQIMQQAARLMTSTMGASGIDVIFSPCSKVHDGRYANNGWLQELPDAVTKVSWDNPLLISKATAERLGLETGRHANGNEYNTGQVATVTLDGRSVDLPIWAVPGMPDDTVVCTMGYGRTAGGRVAQGTGFDVFPIRRSSDVGFASGATVERARGASPVRLACTQDHWAMEGRAIVREVDLPAWRKYGDVDISNDADIQKDPYDHSRDLNFAGRLGIEGHAPANIHIYTDKQQKDWGGSRQHVDQYLEIGDDGLALRDANGRPVSKLNKYGKRYQQWGMSIDLNTCTGCGSCTMACQAENNIPIVGKDEVSKGREMSWIRVDRYFSSGRTEYGPTKLGGEEPAAMWESPEMITMPVACVHCESAPCEVVCPVNATVHSESGTNDMTYNRCIGTRYCANNCPYKVRRFNLFDYATKEYKGGFGQVAEGVTEGLMPANQNFMPPRFREPTSEVRQMVNNPHVTVRSRGVMEKCTYCVQRINQAKVETKLEDMDFVPDGFFQTACQQACPSDSIVFGDIYDYMSNDGAGSAAHQSRNSGRTYGLLAYLNTRPRTTYMIKLRNPNPTLREPVVEPFHHGDEHGDGHGDSHGGDQTDDHANADGGRIMSLPVLNTLANGALLS